MNTPHPCGTVKQPCPTPYLCSTGCAYADNPGYRHILLDAPMNWWDRCGVVGKTITVFALVLACMFTAGVVVGFAS